MLSFNNLTFAPFGTGDSSGHHGFYKRGPRGIHLYRQNGALEAYIVNNPQQGRFIVSAHDHSGQTVYMFSTCSLTEKWLGIENVSMMQIDDLIAQLH